MATPEKRAPLAALLPARGEPPLSTDETLNRFVGYVTSNGLELYPAQEEAILELLAGNHLFLKTPTGSGKSLVAMALHFKAMAEGKVSYYTCPIKALVNEKFFALCDAFGPENVGMLTGDASINREAPIICCTAEILANMAMRDSRAPVDYVVMDEFHYYSDRERGTAWQLPLLGLQNTTFLMMSATLGDTHIIEEGLKKLTGKDVVSVRSAKRPVPLDFDYRETPLHETIQDLVARGKYPIYLVNFTQRAAAEQAQNLMSVDFCTKEEKEAIRQALMEAPFDTPYGKEFQRFLRHGVGMHHAGLLPKYRLLVEKLAQSGHLKVISGTDTLGVGVNIPIRTVLFTQLFKFNGEKLATLSVRDFQQIAGRAGRKGYDDEGSVVAQAPDHVVENIKQAQKEAAGKKKAPKAKPPQKGYIHYDKSTFERLQNGMPEPLESRFEVSHGLLLNLLQSDLTEGSGGYRRLVQLIQRTHDSDYKKRKHLKTAAACFRTLRDAGIVDVEKRSGGAVVKVAEGLQRDFSLNHTLSLYLLDTLEKLDPTLETYALDVVTLVESILENPEVVLYAQLHQLKGEKIAEMKAQGIEYDDRMAELEKLEWPKPNRDFIYGTFNLFAAKHPWVGQENIRPKSIVRDMFERFMSFHDYVREYGLQRSEGVLLRYVGDAYKALVQTVPERFRDETVEDFIDHLRATLRQVDSSLLDEWERMKNPEAALAPKPVVELKPRELTDDPKAFAARVREELHRLLRMLGQKRYGDALAMLDGAVGEWTATKLEQAMAPYLEEHKVVVLTPAARRPSLTFLKEAGTRQWEVQQRIMDPEGHGDWLLDCEIDLRGRKLDDGPILILRRIGT
ncbi:DEAD/DEAH box helicase [Stigmatella aurantiaca]|uniref:DEAD/DEAH box helicase n=1 Tax=Stigmatella aurantiaca (strain DW4/3-1) TaxID=378806 RepID=Q08PM9_STIAD|nr:DEAD/DEAH box helicase [Stigmatella aurantiaca]ADO71371.1 DEAD/DEAH box helicase [Stigmatella aurantiaca DW4/3-1]EAU62437.1 heliCase, c-terminal:dead/deah box helicase, n-terminal [Stigmatella aurantiaca DW4/3-1]